RMLLTSRKLLQRKLLDVESDLRGTLRNFGLKVGAVSSFRYDAPHLDSTQVRWKPDARRPRKPTSRLGSPILHFAQEPRRLLSRAYQVGDRLVNPGTPRMRAARNLCIMRRD